MNRIEQLMQEEVSPSEEAVELAVLEQFRRFATLERARLSQRALERERLLAIQERIAEVAQARQAAALRDQRPLPPIPEQPESHPHPFFTSREPTPPIYVPRELPLPPCFLPPGSEPMAANNSNAFPSLDTSFNNRAASPAQGNQANGAAMNNSANYMAPLPVGHQQDLNYLYAQIQELSSVLQSNREKAAEVIRTAEEVARQRVNGVNGTTETDADHEADATRIRTLEHELRQSEHKVSLYRHEQTENTKLIAMYEDALGTATEQIRNYCNDIDSRFLTQRRHYNNLLQAEKDEHLASRLDRDHWHAETLRCAEMIRTAYRLRCEEWGDEYRVVAGLQSEVRCLRRCMGMEAERPEDETGWEYLREAPINDQA